MGGALLAGGLGLYQNATNRTAQYKAARAAEDQADTYGAAYDKYLNELRSYLSTESTKAKDTASEDAKTAQLNLGQNLARAGITGGKGAQAVGAKGITNIEGLLQKRYGEIESGVAGRIAEAEKEKALGMAPLESAVEGAKGALRGSEIKLDTSKLTPAALLGPSSAFADVFRTGALTGGDQLLQTMAPALLAGGLGMGANAMGLANVDPSAIMQQQAMSQVMGEFGINPQAFSTGGGGLPQQVGDTTYTPTRDIFGNVTYTKSGSTKSNAISSQDAKALSDFDLYINSKQKETKTYGVQAKSQYIEQRNLIGQKVTVNGITKTYKGNGVWK